MLMLFRYNLLGIDTPISSLQDGVGVDIAVSAGT